MVGKKVYRSSQGKSVDLGALLLQNETVRAVGNMGVNARGDRVDNRNIVVDTKVQQSKRRYNKQIGPQDDIPQTNASPVSNSISPAPIAPDPYTLQRSNAKEDKAFKETRRVKTPKVAKTTKPEPAPVIDEKILNVEPTVVAVEEPTAKGGLADAIARAKTIKQEQSKTPRQLAQEKSGVKKI